MNAQKPVGIDWQTKTIDVSTILDRMIAEGEHQQQDFKYAINDSRKIAKSLVAFANTDGGRLLIGVKDNGMVAGVADEEEYYMIEAAAQLYCKPVIEFVTLRHETKKIRLFLKYKFRKAINYLIMPRIRTASGGLISVWQTRIFWPIKYNLRYGDALKRYMERILNTRMVRS